MPVMPELRRGLVSRTAASPQYHGRRSPNATSGRLLASYVDDNAAEDEDALALQRFEERLRARPPAAPSLEQIQQKEEQWLQQIRDRRPANAVGETAGGRRTWDSPERPLAFPCVDRGFSPEQRSLSPERMAKLDVVQRELAAKQVALMDELVDSRIGDAFNGAVENAELRLSESVSSMVRVAIEQQLQQQSERTDSNIRSLDDRVARLEVAFDELKVLASSGRATSEGTRSEEVLSMVDACNSAIVRQARELQELRSALETSRPGNEHSSALRDEIVELRSAHASLARDLEVRHAAATDEARSVETRSGELTSESTRELANELKDVRSKLDRAHGQLDRHEQAHAQVSRELGEMRAYGHEDLRARVFDDVSKHHEEVIQNVHKEVTRSLEVQRAEHLQLCSKAVEGVTAARSTGDGSQVFKSTELLRMVEDERAARLEHERVFRAHQKDHKSVAETAASAAEKSVKLERAVKAIEERVGEVADRHAESLDRKEVQRLIAVEKAGREELEKSFKVHQKSHRDVVATAASGAESVTKLEEAVRALESRGVNRAQSSSITDSWVEEERAARQELEKSFNRHQKDYKSVAATAAGSAETLARLEATVQAMGDRARSPLEGEDLKQIRELIASERDARLRLERRFRDSGGGERTEIDGYVDRRFGDISGTLDTTLHTLQRLEEDLAALGARVDAMTTGDGRVMPTSTGNFYASDSPPKQAAAELHERLVGLTAFAQESATGTLQGSSAPLAIAESRILPNRAYTDSYNGVSQWDATALQQDSADSRRSRSLVVPGKVQTTTREAPSGRRTLDTVGERLSPAPSPRGLTPSALLLRLMGFWQTEEGIVLGEVKKEFMHWDSAFDHNETRITILADGKVQMELAGEMHEAEYFAGPPLELRWSDGEKWIQMKSNITRRSMTFRPSLQTPDELTSIIALALGTEELGGNILLERGKSKRNEPKIISGLDVEQLEKRILWIGKLVRAALGREDDLRKQMRGPAGALSNRGCPSLSPAMSPDPSPRPETPGASSAQRTRLIRGVSQQLEGGIDVDARQSPLTAPEVRDHTQWNATENLQGNTVSSEARSEKELNQAHSMKLHLDLVQQAMKPER
jgi:hypothetical protein